MREMVETYERQQRQRQEAAARREREAMRDDADDEKQQQQQQQPGPTQETMRARMEINLAVNALLTGEINMDDIDELHVTQQWRRMLERLGMREMVETYERQQRQRQEAAARREREAMRDDADDEKQQQQQQQPGPTQETSARTSDVRADEAPTPL
ncbi:MAG: hypothetical protein MHM6MM_009554, partial [Cercozoa sp. M6MM]